MLPDACMVACVKRRLDGCARPGFLLLRLLRRLQQADHAPERSDTSVALQRVSVLLALRPLQRRLAPAPAAAGCGGRASLHIGQVRGT